jgi:hypothetical protein
VLATALWSTSARMPVILVRNGLGERPSSAEDNSANPAEGPCRDDVIFLQNLRLHEAVLMTRGSSQADKEAQDSGCIRTCGAIHGYSRTR